MLYKEVDEFCNEHYILKEKDGNIAIYKLDSNNNQIFLEDTEVAVEYLEGTDLDKIKQGLKVYTKKELNKTIEDFE